MDAASLKKIIAAGESASVEFKRSLPPEPKVAQSLSAFANTEGGTLLVGVHDDGSVAGLAALESVTVLQRLRSVADSLVTWPYASGNVELADGQRVVWLRLERAPVHLWPVRTAAGTFYERVGTTNRARLPIQSTLQRGAVQVPLTLFVAMSFRTEEDPALEDYFEAMKRASVAVGSQLKISRMDLAEGDFEISQKIMQEIDVADLVLADFTLSSSNVYFELGYARGKGKRVIQTARKGTPLEFDIRNWKTIFYRNATELETALLSAFQQAVNDLQRSSGA